MTKAKLSLRSIKESDYTLLLKWTQNEEIDIYPLNVESMSEEEIKQWVSSIYPIGIIYIIMSQEEQEKHFFYHF